MRISAILTTLAGVLLVASCSSSPKSESGPAPAAGGGKHVDAATAGTVTGRVTFEGARLPAEPLKMGSEPACAESAGPNPQNDAVLIAPDGSLQNVFVYVKEGLDPAYSFEAPATPVMLDQKGCRYIPRVVGVRVGQPLDILNSDATMHNVHALPKDNQEFNAMLQMQGFHVKPMRTFTKPEVMVRFKCDIHNWMSAWVGVMAHPFFAVTNDKGAFDLSGLPPGTYTIEAWHERFGTQTTKVTVGDHQTQSVSFTFTAAAAKS